MINRRGILGITLPLFVGVQVMLVIATPLLTPTPLPAPSCHDLQDVSKIRIGTLSPHAIEALRHIRDFFGVTFQIEADRETKSVLCTCLGLGFTNYAKKVT